MTTNNLENEFLGRTGAKINELVLYHYTIHIHSLFLNL